MSDTKMDFFEVGDKTAMICADPHMTESVQHTLRDLAYKFHTADSFETAIERMRYTPYDIILVQETFSGGSLKSNAVMNYLASLPMSQRRQSMVVLVGPSFKTLDAMQAFGQSVHLVVNDGDVRNLTAILKKSRAEFDLLYKIYNDVVVSLTER